MNNLNKKVLALNSHWMPIDIISVRDAFRLVAKGHAKFLETIEGSYALYTMESWFDLHLKELYDHINTVSNKVPIPEIIILSHYSEIPKRKISFCKENLLLRDDEKCVYCQRPLTLQTMTVDHVVPQCLGGKTTWENCVTACSTCNHDKADKRPTGKYKPKRAPKEPHGGSPIYKLIKTTKGKNIPESWKKFLFH